MSAGTAQDQRAAIDPSAGIDGAQHVGSRVGQGEGACAGFGKITRDAGDLAADGEVVGGLDGGAGSQNGQPAVRRHVGAGIVQSRAAQGEVGGVGSGGSNRAGAAAIGEG